MNETDLNRCLTMAAFSAFITLRQYTNKYPPWDVARAIKEIKTINSDAANLDYVGGNLIFGLLPPDFDISNARVSHRRVVFELIKIAQPWWLRHVPYGRDKVKAALGQDQVQCLREAGLLEPIPDEEVVAWWDAIAETMRGVVDLEKMVRAREAERLSLEYERERLKRIGVSREPEWVSLEDNTLGYDIRSFDVDGGQIITRLIEVKSTLADSVFVTRREWNNATSAEPHYFFHVWRLPEKTMQEYPVATVRPNIPTDNGVGYWQDARIDIFAS